MITPNENEAFAALGIGGVSAPEPLEVGRRLMKATRCRGLVLTQGNEGMIVFDGARRPVRIPIHGSDEVTDVTGAGDTVAAVVTAVVAAGGRLVEAAELANVAAGLAVMKRGAATVSREELEGALRARA